MTTREFLSHLRSLDVEVWIDGDLLRCSAPRMVLTPTLRAELTNRKEEIITFLHAAKTWSASSSSIVPIQSAGSKRPFFGVPGHNGDVFCYVRLARHLGPDQPFYALQPPGLDGRRPPLTRVEDLAAHFVDELCAFQPEGPYLVGGYCLGGTVAFEMARQIRARGLNVALLVLFEGSCPTAYLPLNAIRILIRYQFRRVVAHVRTLSQLGPRDQLHYLLDKARKLREQMVHRDGNDSEKAGDPNIQVGEATIAAVRNYVARVYPGRIHLFLASEESRDLSYGRQLDWEAFAAGGLEVHVGPVDCDHATMLREPHVQVFAELLRESLHHVQAHDFQ